MNLYLERLMKQREELRASAQTVLEGAAKEGRDVTDVERESVQGQYREIERLDKEIDPLHQAELRQAEHDKQVSELERVTRSRQEAAGGEVPSGGQLDRYRGRVGNYLADWGNQLRDPAAAQRIRRATAEYRVVADQLLADNPGIVPVPIVGPVEGTLPTARPFIDSVTSRPMPANGSTFNRPKITQHTAVGPQATEKTQLLSQKMTITDIPVAKKTFGGTLDVSFQNRDWSDPAILSIAVADMQAVYADVTDNEAADTFVAGVTGTFTLPDFSGAGPIRSALMTAAAEIFTAVKRYPNTLWVAPDIYAQLGAVTGPEGTPSFPGLSDATGAGGTIMGLKAVVDPNFAAGTMIVGASSFVEHYETVGGLLSVTEPTILGYTIAYYGYVADLLLDTGAASKRVVA